METAIITSNNQFLDFEKEKVQILTLDQLERTKNEDDVYGNPVMGIYHHDLLKQVICMANEFGYNVEVYDLFAAQNKEAGRNGVTLLPALESIHGEKAVEAHILRRVYANIRLTDFDDDENTTNLAVAYHQKGIQVGFGNNVRICHNQCMLGPEFYASTYSDKGRGRGKGMTVPEMMEAVRSWLFDAQHIIITQRQQIEQMKSIEVDADTVLRFIGLLTATRVKCDTRHQCIRDTKTYPLNQSQITKYTEQLLLKYHENHNLTVWDLYNTATDLYKADAMDIPQLLPQNRAMVSMLDNQFALGLGY